MAKATEKRIYLTRHAQAEHNVAEDYTIHDALLTELGRQQAAKLHADTHHTIQQSAELLVTSPLRRTLSTTVIGYETLRTKLEQQGKQVVVLPQLQECNNLPCDIGSPREALESVPEYAGLSFHHLDPSWTSKSEFYAASNSALKARARWVRQYLRSLPEREIVVVSHGDCLRYITEGHKSHHPWANVEVREYTFAVEEEEDVEGEAWVVPVTRVVKEGDDRPTSSAKVFKN
ncbi:phosphoglycerate mutase-like protein [Laetiporus sulphureus 93-53]|uniref:Phosphoglycerate mutase-like protein n=1 Tax=Laetiporus sulphureus 93-53 TaxID=1314785 RepID=A0A165IK30_9APHY|nr:phosphoglycerate mutase-like protein [Laetiporus sulphureus 93-53]KZT13189.1 phosphoglycerate mutase-like protein [Laetiporus sulphureus 93-53]